MTVRSTDPPDIRDHPAPEAAFDAALGDGPWEAASAELDAAEAFPTQQCDRLDAAGLPAYYVPTEWGGALDNHERLLRLWRTVARRELSPAIAHGKTYLGAACVWLAGTPEQAGATARAVLAGEPVAWALSERDHGADLLGGDLTAAANGDGYVLDGAKWPINNATRARLVTVLARTGAAGAARGQSLFLVDKAALDPGTWRALPKVATHGIRGIDISGLAFDGAAVPASALLGPPGTGLETVLRALQLTRTMCAALSVGAGEHALRLVGGFVAARVIQRRPLAERAYPASLLGRCAALLAAAEATALLGSRCVHALPAELSVTSSIVKAALPALIDAALRDLTELLGARSFLLDVYGHGAFERLCRDHRVVGVFDGSTPVVRAALVQQFSQLARGYAAATVDGAGLAHAVAVGDRPPALDRDRLRLLSTTGCSVVQSLPALAGDLAGPAAVRGLTGHAAALAGVAAHVCARMADLRPSARPTMEAYELAEAYELCFVGAACLWLWSAGQERHRGEPLWTDGLWVRAALRAVRARLAAVLRIAEPDDGDDGVESHLARLVIEAIGAGGPVSPFGTPVRHADVRAVPVPEQRRGQHEPADRQRAEHGERT